MSAAFQQSASVKPNCLSTCTKWSFILYMSALWKPSFKSSSSTTQLSMYALFSLIHLATAADLGTCLVDGRVQMYTSLIASMNADKGLQYLLPPCSQKPSLSNLRQLLETATFALHSLQSMTSLSAHCLHSLYLLTSSGKYDPSWTLVITPSQSTKQIFTSHLYNLVVPSP